MWAKLIQQIWEWRGVLITAPSVAGLLIALRLAGWMQPLEWWAFDQFFRLRPLEAPDPRIVIVGINEADLQKVGTWPVPDAVIAQLLEKLKKQQPSAIGLDIFRDIPIAPGQQALVKVFESTPNLIGIQKRIGRENNPAIAPNPVLRQLGQSSAVDVVVDADGKLRRGMLYVTPEENDPGTSLGLRLALMYLNARGIREEAAAANPLYLQLGQAVFPTFEANDGGYVQADDGGYQVLLNFRGPARTFETVSMTDVLEDEISPNLMRDRIVLIGVTATSIKDFFSTPYSSSLITAPQQTPGVEVQANLASQILSSALDGRSQIQIWPDSWEWLWMVGWSWIGATLTWTGRYAGGVTQKSLLTRHWRAIISGNMREWTFLSVLLAAGSLTGVCYLAFVGGWWIPVVPPALALVGSAVIMTAYIANLERQDRRTVMNLFGRHVTPKIAEAIWRDRHQLLKEGRLVGQKMTATVLFTDLKSFSSIAEHTDPEILMSWLNEYMGAMAGIVFDHDGVVDKFIGDSVMAVFGVPIARTTPEAIAKDAEQAVRCALSMTTILKSLNQKWQAQGRPTAAMRVGIATGTVIVGSLGSSQRLDYTTMGDSVNIASRLESYDKSIADGICRILINEETYLYTQNQFPTQKIGRVLFKGREQATVVYQIILE